MSYSFHLIFLCLLPLVAGRELAAQNRQEYIQLLAGKYYRLSGLTMSQDGKWITIRKTLDLNTDTVLIISSLYPEKPVGFRTQVGSTVFPSNDYLLMQSSHQAELLNLTDNSSVYFNGVKNIQELKYKKQFVLHYTEEEKSRLELHNANGDLLNSMDNVSRFYITGSSHIYAITENEKSEFEVTLFNDRTKEKVYGTSQKISYLEIDPGEHGIMVYEQKSKSDFVEILYLDLKTKAGFRLKEVLPISFQNGFSEVIREGSNYFLRLGVIKEKDDTSVVDIWYGNDNRLELKFHPSSQELYYIWEPKTKKVERIGDDQMTTFINMGNNLHFLSYNQYLLKDYQSYIPNLRISLYDLQSDGFSPVDTIQPELFVSKKGENILYKKLEGWCLYQCTKGIRKIIPDPMLKTPYFSLDRKSVLFDGEGGLWRYIIENGGLMKLIDFSGNKTILLNGTIKNLNSFRFYIHYVSEKQPLILELDNSLENRSTFVLWQKNKYDTIIPTTNKRICNLIYDETYSHFCFIEEDYNMPPRVVYRKTGEEVKVLYQSNKADSAILSLKQEIISYINNEGIPLKGILYYPLYYKPSHKYPMVVHIYQVQSNKKSNEYPVSSYGKANNDGFDLRLLLEKGYFVYFPDIVYGEKGPGLSALDCVNHALDAVKNNLSIDKSKIGLIGHSHGGYETNFIATHSDRFAAYVSGAGNSDIVRSYFSFNYNFLSPFYWQYENGQYQMNKSFQEDKILYFQNNPIHYVDQVASPVLLWAGMKDRNIYWEQTMEYYIGLKRNNKKVIALFYPDEGHALINSTACRDLVSRVLDWFDYFLMGTENIDWINREVKEDAGRHPPIK
jgi:acetyl esterase/lipase/1,2-phenylacetyl-CoA epoxidase PaaB subunit